MALNNQPDAIPATSRSTTTAETPVASAPAAPVAAHHDIDLDTVKRVSGDLHRASTSAATTQARLANQVQAEAVIAAPHVTTVVSFDKPFLIWELPHPRPGFDPKYQSGASSTTLKAIEVSGGGTTQEIFYFIWTNASSFAAVVNVKTTVEMIGLIQVIADSGVFNEETTTAAVNCELDILRWSGWGLDPQTGGPTDETPLPFGQSTQRQAVASLGVRGFHFTSNQRTQEIGGDEHNLSAALIAIPAGATTMFQVTTTAQWGLTGNGLPNRAAIDFETLGRSIVCTGLTLEVLTPTGATTTGSATGTATGPATTTTEAGTTTHVGHGPVDRIPRPSLRTRKRPETD